ncbi:MAG: hypothetical protein R3E12_11820 [Candidatus Eisenbacteria bacterium]
MSRALLRSDRRVHESGFRPNNGVLAVVGAFEPEDLLAGSRGQARFPGAGRALTRAPADSRGHGADRGDVQKDDVVQAADPVDGSGFRGTIPIMCRSWS